MKLLSIILIMVAFNAVAQPVKVMTYNIRLDVVSDGINQWSNRKEKLPALIAKYDPDVVGLQEVIHHQLMDILKALPAYGYIGVGRDDGKEKGEYSPILYKKDRFELISQKTSWLSETPEVPGSKNWDAAITRMVTRGIFKEKKSGQSFLFFNTHFDHIGKEARHQSAKIIVNLIASERPQPSTPVLVTGDFNSETSEAAYQFIANSKVVADARLDGSSQGTFCTFDVNGPPCRLIDYVFHSPQFKVTSYQVISDNDTQYYPSDHLPVMVTVEAAGR